MFDEYVVKLRKAKPASNEIGERYCPASYSVFVNDNLMGHLIGKVNKDYRTPDRHWYEFQTLEGTVVTNDFGVRGEALKRLEVVAIAEFDRIAEDPDSDRFILYVQEGSDAHTMWVHASDGSTVGRFSRRFGIDLHNTVSAQLNGASQCLHCTHTPGTKEDWKTFRDKMLETFNFYVDPKIISFREKLEHFGGSCPLPVSDSTPDAQVIS
ncbi:hypothetical protein ACYPKM_02240 [Pseudomonas aeruginosa]